MSVKLPATGPTVKRIRAKLRVGNKAELTRAAVLRRLSLDA